MPHSLNYKPIANEADLVYKVLELNGRPMNYQSLITEVLNQMDSPVSPARISMILTTINLDTRFIYVGQGEWALKAWLPAKGNRRSAGVSLLNKASANNGKVKIAEPEGDIEESDLEINEYEEEQEDVDSFDEGELHQESW